MHLPTRLARVHARDLRLHFLSLPTDDRRLRFGRTMNDAALGAYVETIDFTRDALFGVFDAQRLLVGVAHLARGDDCAELGLSVLPAGRRSGIAASLLERAITHARACRITLLTLHCMSENEPMRRLAQRARMSIAREHGELQAELRLAPATRGTAMADWVEQGMAAANDAWRAQWAAQWSGPLAGCGLHRSRPAQHLVQSTGHANDDAAERRHAVSAQAGSQPQIAQGRSLGPRFRGDDTRDASRTPTVTETLDQPV